MKKKSHNSKSCEESIYSHMWRVRHLFQYKFSFKSLLVMIVQLVVNNVSVIYELFNFSTKF